MLRLPDHEAISFWGLTLFLHLLPNRHINLPPPTPHNLRPPTQPKLLQRNVAAKPGIFYDLGGKARACFSVGRHDVIRCLLLWGVALGFVVGIAFFAGTEDGGGSVDEGLEEEQEGLEGADGQEVCAFDDDEPSVGAEDAFDFGDGVGIVDVFGWEGADDVVKCALGEWQGLCPALDDEGGRAEFAFAQGFSCGLDHLRRVLDGMAGVACF